MIEKRFTGHDVYDGVKERFQFYDNHKRISNEDVLNLLNNFAKKENYHRKNRRELINENNRYRGELSKFEKAIEDRTIEIKELPEKGNSRLIYVVNGLEYIYFKGQWECLGKRE